MAQAPNDLVMQVDDDPSDATFPVPAPVNPHQRKRALNHSANEFDDTQSPQKRMSKTARPHAPMMPQEEEHIDEPDPDEEAGLHDAAIRFLERDRESDDENPFDDPTKPIHYAPPEEDEEGTDQDLGPTAGWIDEKQRDDADVIHHADEPGEENDTVLGLNWSSDDERSAGDYDDDDHHHAYAYRGDEKENDDGDVDAMDEDGQQQQQRVYLPGDDNNMESDEKVVHINEAYTCLHKFTVEWPCLSFDVMRDSLGAMRRRVPYTMYLAVGTQADSHSSNQILFLKLNNLQKTKYDDKDDSDESEDDEDYEDLTDDQPVLQDRRINHRGGVNRIRCMSQQPHIVATWSDNAHVYIWNGEDHLKALDGQAGVPRPNIRPAYELRNSDEGFALAWSPHDEGWLLSGSCDGELTLMEPRGSSWIAKKFKTAKGRSIEDVAWSPNQNQVFTSVGVDKCIRVWDVRKRKGCVREVKDAHRDDINVVSWNRHQQHLLLTGSDDRSFAVWDMRLFRKNGKTHNLAPYAHYAWHTRPITSVEWHPLSASELCVSSEDNRISLWDLSLEEDESRRPKGASIDGQAIPPQMMFCHGGQQDIKEIHWHPQIPNLVISTALSGFHVFKPDNLVDEFAALSIS